MPERTLIVAATNTLVRGYAVVPTDRLSDAGAPVNALFAVTRALVNGLAFKQPARAVALVASGPTPADWPPALAQQATHLPALLRAFGFPVVETSDELHLCAAYARAALEAGDDVIIVGADKRLAQLVGEGVWWYDPNKDARYTVDMVKKRFGVAPGQVAEWLALVGNEDDGLPGVAGIGAKGATALLEAHGTVAKALEALDSIGGRAGNALRAARDLIPAEVARCRLDAQRPLPVPLEQLTWRAPAGASLNATLKPLGFVEFLASDGADRVDVTVCASPQDVRAALATWGATPVGVHPVTEDPSPVRGALVGLALSAGEGRACFVPLKDGPVDPALAAWLEDAAAPKLAHDSKDLDVALRRRGVRLAGVAGDTAVASHLTQPSNWAPHDLSVVARHVLGRALPSDDEARGVGARRKPWAAVPVDKVAQHAGLLADVTARVWRELGPKVNAEQHAEYLALDDTLARMELAGIAVDASELDRAEADFIPLGEALEKDIFALAGKSFELGSTRQLGEVLFGQLKLPVVSHTKTGWSTATEALERIEHAHPIVPLVIRWRMLRRLMDSWVKALRGDIGPDGRVHSSFHAARSFSGRIVNSSPDLGRVPGRTPEMARIRRAFVAKPGHVLMSVDYNQLGLHVLAHLTKDPALVGPLREHADVHRLTAAAVLEKRPEDVTADERQLGKVVNFATFAGQGASALAQQLGVDAAEAKQLIARFDRKYSQVRAFQDEQERLARERGYLVTLAGRRWPIGGLESLDPMLRGYAERLARRGTHEGSVCDVSRRGLLDADRALRKAGLAAAPLVQVLDEVLFEVPEVELREAARVASEAMKNAFQLEAPLRVGVEVGPNWADLSPLSP
ncbi:MAG: DNA polymerase [Myxococcota bacterium]